MSKKYDEGIFAIVPFAVGIYTPFFDTENVLVDYLLHTGNVPFSQLFGLSDDDILSQKMSTMLSHEDFDWKDFVVQLKEREEYTLPIIIGDVQYTLICYNPSSDSVTLVFLKQEIRHSKEMIPTKKCWSEMENNGEENNPQQQVFETLLASVSSHLVNAITENELGFNNTLNRVLEAIGTFTGMDRIHYFRYFEENGVEYLTNTHEWCIEGIDFAHELLQKIPTSEFPGWMNTLRRNEDVYIPDVAELPVTWKNEKEIMQAQQIKSVLAVPVYSKERLIGSLGFDAVRDYASWNQEYINLFRIIADILGAVTYRVDQQRDLERAIKHAQEMAQIIMSADAAKTEFLAKMSHEIRTPMYGIVGMIGLLMETSLSPKQHHYADIIYQSCERLLGIVNDVLDLSKIEAKMMDLKPVSFNLRAMLEGFFELLCCSLQEQKDIELLLFVDSTIPDTIIGDAGRLRQILINLVGNALKFTKSGEVCVSVSLIEHLNQTVKLLFQVKDTGIGIDQEEIPLLFDPFIQSSGNTFGGTGLGLPICRQLVEMMNGKMWVESKKNIGSQFSFTVECSLEKPLAQTATHYVKNALQDVCILVVDDNMSSATLLKNLLERSGAYVSVTTSAASALNLLATSTYTIALIDYLMPITNGVELTKIIRAQSRWNDLKLVLMVPLLEKWSKEFTHTTGFQGYLTKPILEGSLIETVLSILQNRDIDESHSFPADDFSSKVIHKKQGKILLVVDNPVNTEIITEILREYTLASTPDGIEALEMLKQDQDYALILMDCLMPRMDGYETTKRIRRGEVGESYTHIPIIAQTANVFESEKKKCLLVGMNDCIAKSTSPEILREIVAHWLPQESDESAFPKQEREESDVFCSEDGGVKTEREINTALSEVVQELSDILSLCPDSSIRERICNVIDKSTNVAGDIRKKGSLVEDIPIFDQKTFIYRMMNDQELARIIMRSFVKDMPKQAVALTQNPLSAEYIDDIKRYAHTIKGTSSNIGAEQIRFEAEKMERYCGEVVSGMTPFSQEEIDHLYTMIQNAFETFFVSAEVQKFLV